MKFIYLISFICVVFLSKIVYSQTIAVVNIQSLIDNNFYYKQIINDLMKWCDLQILQVLVANKINIEEGVHTTNTELITSLNQYSQFKNTLQGVYDGVLTNLQAKQ